MSLLLACYQLIWVCFQGILLVLCAWFIIFPENALSSSLSRYNGTLNNFNTSSNSSADVSLSRRRHVGRPRRPSVHTRKRGPMNNTRTPTNTKLIRLYFRVGLLLHVNKNGSISGSLNETSNYGKKNKHGEHSLLTVFSATYNAPVQKNELKNIILKRY